MTKTISISGKGGTGKTTLSALMVRCLMEKSDHAVLAVDADANACLGRLLGVESIATVADLREETLQGKSISGKGMGKLETFEFGCHRIITENDGFDLLTMGRPEGPNCYCAVNNVLRKYIDQLSSSYGYVITDNEAGMEHLSRRTTNNVDWLIVVGEPTELGKITVKRIIKLARTLPINVGKIGVIWNKTTTSIPVDDVGVLGCVPNDKTVLDAAIKDKNVFELDKNTPALSAVREILQKNIGIG